ncbi:cysteine desulfurase [Clostridium carboxidivorans P7]|uniref:Cysteine desulfurase IscS n=1 Tax=Clostridium carboxidivorans P7 TaxID=536227 RepID=C6PSK0_9CLOT|nr:cysteine desulfurase NifS [Clostridium carboxidivorans]AKN30604.1 cysteine desulfurase [Clostridium carboxidivorans P7]EET87774.1 cysteine desulfurase NifS [Clostridium carboxidivorans P7]EFG86356.1 cysteine desulfurase NifS [Clostridium carboxidivorans P7]
MSREVYMDHAATTYMKEEVIEEMKPYLTDYFGNPSSIYKISRKTKMAIDESRMRIANAINANADEIYFTAGGSEADNWALKGTALANKDKGNHIITTAIEHHAILHSCEYLEKLGFEVTYLPVNEFGIVDVEDVKKSITDKTILVSIMFANNEIGSIQPIEQIGSICRSQGIIFHTDGVQAVGSIPIDVKKMNIDLLSMASHKFYGPKGIGALYMRKGIKVDNLIHGGAQERAKRAGTENVMAIAGMGKAIELADQNMQEERRRLTYLRDKMINELLNIPETKLNGADGENRLPGNVNISFESVDGDTLLMLLDSEGICASSGSACSAGALEPSHVLMAIGLNKDLAKGSLRLTLGYKTTEEDVEYVVNTIKEVVNKIRDNKKKWQ